MKRIPSDMVKLFDGTTPERCAFSMQLAAEMQHALDRWTEKHPEYIETSDFYLKGYSEGDFIRRNCHIKRDRLTMDPEGDWKDIVFFRQTPMFSVVWNVKNQTIVVEDFP